MLTRPTIPNDTTLLLTLTQGTGMFKPIEIDALREVLEDYHAIEHTHRHFAITMDVDGVIGGFAYYAPTPMTDNSWHLYWIVVERSLQGKGVGATLLKHVEDHIRSLGGRVLFVETSSTPHYEPTRQFYLKKGYEITGVIKQFYSDEDDMVVFRKRLR
jgi:GNAT superfamily N-acetyltransferase